MRALSKQSLRFYRSRPDQGGDIWLDAWIYASNLTKYEIDNKNQKEKDMMQGDDKQFAHWIMNDARKYGVNGRRFR